MSHSEPFFGRRAELDELMRFLSSPSCALYILQGNPGMGKSALIRQLLRLCDERSLVSFTHIFPIASDESPEDLARELNHTLAKGRFLIWGPGSHSQLKTIAEALPPLGSLISALLGERTVSERSKLLRLLRLIGAKTEKPVLLAFDPFDYLKRTDYEEFFLALAQEVPQNIKLIIPQRQTDILAASTRIKLVDRVIRNDCILGPLAEEHANAMANALLKQDNVPGDVLKLIWDKYQGWPLAIRMAASALQMSPEFVLRVPPDLKTLCTHMFASCPQDSLRVFYSLAVVPAAIQFEDLSELSGLSPEEVAAALDTPQVAQGVVKEEKHDTIHLRFFHVVFRDYVREYMQSRQVDETPYIARLHKHLRKLAESIDRETRSIGVGERDARALGLSRKLLLYRSVLRRSEELQYLAEHLLLRVASLRYGGRSYALYSLLIIGSAGALLIAPDRMEWALGVLHGVTFDDSFLHPEYAVLLMGHLLVRYAKHLDDEMRELINKRLTELTNQDHLKDLSVVASRTVNFVAQGQDPLAISEMDAMLPKIYNDESFHTVSEEEFTAVERRAKELIMTSTYEWSTADRELMYKYIRMTEARSKQGRCAASRSLEGHRK